MRNRYLLFPAIVLYSFLFLSTAASQGMPPTLVETEKVVRLEFNDQVTLVGRTKAWVDSRIVSEVSGRVQKINAGEGVPIRADQPLITVDADRIRYQYKAKKAQANQTRVESELATTQLERARELFDKDLISQTSLDSALAWDAIQRERFNELDAERARLALDLKNCAITAPFTGFTGQRLVEVGEWVSPGMPVFEMVDLSRIRITVDLPERYFEQLSVGNTVAVELSQSDLPTLTGSVIGITPNASEETHTFPVIIEVPNADRRLGGGMLVRASLSLNKRFSSLAVSKDAIIRQGSGTIVYTVVEGKASLIPVTISSTKGQMVAVSSERLSEGLPVVVRGNERIFPGSPVNAGGNMPPQSESETGN